MLGRVPSLTLRVVLNHIYEAVVTLQETCCDDVINELASFEVFVVVYVDFGEEVA